MGFFGLFSKQSEPIPIWFKTDIHCHVLPGIDDGSPDVETSLQLIQDMCELGIERIIASPHVESVQFPNTHETLAQAYDSLQEALQGSNISVPISYSAEYRIDERFDALLSERNILPYPGDYVLIENGWIQEAWNIEQLIFDMQIKGYQPMLAHPERFAYYQNKPKRLDELHDKIPFQINLLSLAGYYGKEAQKLAETLLKKEYVDFLGTDIHHSKHIECLRKYLATSAAAKHREMSLSTLQNDRVFKK